ncbi:unnamed protein product [Amoebophrya sp. A25]|nr:unnamed protein product [Amoebophrya sp. A25]|eukprot:GSA25T00017666001.1
MAGLSEVVSLWEEAQKQAKRDGRSSGDPSRSTGSTRGNRMRGIEMHQRGEERTNPNWVRSAETAPEKAPLGGNRVQELRELAKGVEKVNKKQPCTAKFNFGSGINNAVVQIPNVGEILKAEFGYTSLTSKPTDITKELRRFYERQLQSNLHVLRDEKRKRRKSTDGGTDRILGEQGDDCDVDTGAATPRRSRRSSAVSTVSESPLRAPPGRSRSSRRSSHSAVTSEKNPLFHPVEVDPSSRFPPFGTLEIDEETLKSFRNRDSNEKQVLDSGRKSLVQALTLGQAGQNHLVVTYVPMIGGRQGDRREDCGVIGVDTNYRGRPSNTCAFDEMDAAHPHVNARALCEKLRDLKLARRLERQPEYTWYKLCEWLQVEIMEVLVNSLSHTPWFRFPFMEFMRMYFEVLQKEAGIVEELYGFWKAYASMAFVTDLIPGVVMSGIFAQLSLLAQPLKMMQPEAGYEGFDQGNLCEQVVLVCNKRPDHDFRLLAEEGDEQEAVDFWVSIDPIQIKRADLVDLGRRSLEGEVHDPTSLRGQQIEQIIVLETLPFKALGQVLEKIALRVPDARVLEISGQQEVQIRVSVKIINRTGSRGRDREQDGPNDVGHQLHDEQHQPSSPDRSTSRHSLNVRKQEVLDSIEQIPGCKVVLDYKYPKIGNVELPHQVALKVQSYAILELLRTCRMLKTAEVEVVVEQVYDFWGGDS